MSETGSLRHGGTDVARTPLVSLVVPCFNEEEVLPLFLAELRPILGSVPGIRFEFVFVNDGSTDGTLPLLAAEARLDPAVRVIDLSRNFGKEAALSAGLAEARGDAVIPFDADLQPKAWYAMLRRRLSQG